MLEMTFFRKKYWV